MLAALAGYIRRHHIALIALFIAMGGTAYAAAQLPRNSVGPKQLKRGAVTSAKVRDGALRQRDFAPGTLLRGPQGATGPRGLTGLPGARGSDAQFNGAAAGGDLAGTFPNPTIGIVPAAAVTQSGALTVIDDAFVVDVPFANEDYDTEGLHDPANPERLTAPRAGLYQVAASGNYASDASGYRAITIAKNGTTCCGRMLVPPTPSPLPTLLATSTIVPLAAGDFVTMKAQIGGVGQNLDLTQSTLAMQWLGPRP